MSKLEIIFELGGVPTDDKYLDLTEEQWGLLSYFLMIKKQKQAEEFLDMVEYLAMLVSPMPKEAMKIIDGRRKAAQKAKEELGIVVKKTEKKIIEKENGETKYLRNTTFFDDVEKFIGKEAADALRKDQGAEGEESVQQYEMDFEDLEYIRKARERMAEINAQKQKLESFDQVMF